MSISIKDLDDLLNHPLDFKRKYSKKLIFKAIEYAVCDSYDKECASMEEGVFFTSFDLGEAVKEHTPAMSLESSRHKGNDIEVLGTLVVVFDKEFKTAHLASEKDIIIELGEYQSIIKKLFDRQEEEADAVHALAQAMSDIVIEHIVSDFCKEVHYGTEEQLKAEYNQFVTTTMDSMPNIPVDGSDAIKMLYIPENMGFQEFIEKHKGTTAKIHILSQIDIDKITDN